MDDKNNATTLHHFDGVFSFEGEFDPNELAATMSGETVILRWPPKESLSIEGAPFVTQPLEQIDGRIVFIIPMDLPVYNLDGRNRPRRPIFVVYRYAGPIDDSRLRDLESDDSYLLEYIGIIEHGYRGDKIRLHHRHLGNPRIALNKLILVRDADADDVPESNFDVWTFGDGGVLSRSKLKPVFLHINFDKTSMLIVGFDSRTKKFYEATGPLDSAFDTSGGGLPDSHISGDHLQFQVGVLDRVVLVVKADWIGERVLKGTKSEFLDPEKGDLALLRESMPATVAEAGGDDVLKELTAAIEDVDPSSELLVATLTLDGVPGCEVDRVPWPPQGGSRTQEDYTRWMCHVNRPRKE